MLRLNVFLGGRRDSPWRHRGRKKRRSFTQTTLRHKEMWHAVSPWRVCFPRDCLVSAYLHLLAKRSQSGTEAEVRGHTHTNCAAAAAQQTSAQRKDTSWCWFVAFWICSISAGPHGNVFVLVNFTFFLCLNIYPQFIVPDWRPSYGKVYVEISWFPVLLSPREDSHILTCTF